MNQRRVIRELHLNPDLKIHDYYGSVMHENISVDKKRIKFLRDNFVQIKDGDVVFVITLRPKKRK